MNRRSFFQFTGALCASAFVGATAPRPGLTPAGSEETGMRINTEMLRNRNRDRSTVVCRNGIACTSQPLATLSAVETLKKGGNAVDAAICANAMLSLVEPMNCGPGGDLFAIVWSEKDKRLHGLNASGRSPYNWDLKSAMDLGLASIPAYSPLAWSVPGCVSGWQALLERFGSRGPAELFEPVIHYAREGFPVSPIIAQDWQFDQQKFPTLAATFAPGGKTPKFGEVFRNEDLARLFEILVRDGLGAFYDGEIAERIVKFSQGNGGKFSMRDFRDHKADWVDPVSTGYRGYDVWELPPNGQGIAALQIMNMLELFDIGALQPNSAEHLHRFIEAKKLAFEDRAVYYADPQFADVPVARLISKQYAKKRAARINPRAAAVDVCAGDVAASPDTIYLATADCEGNMVSLIQSTYHGWGSHIVPDNLGFPIQNRGMSFALDPSHRNKLEPHKRPLHTIIPAFLTRDGGPVFAFGVMGGDFQPQGHAQVLMNLIDFAMSPQQAGDQPRVAHLGSSTPAGDKMRGGGRVSFERGFPDAVKRALSEMGHQIDPNEDAHGGYQGIWREENPRRYFGASDPRKDGCAIGY